MNFNPADHTLILAPMADLTHGGFRALVEHYGGCDLYYSEMIDARLYRQQGIFEKYYESILPDPKRLVFQIVGTETDELTYAGAGLAELNPAGIDVNMGCSAPHIVQSGAGCALMENTEKAKEMVSRIREAVPPEITVSVKMRLGEKEDGEKLLHFARMLESAGVDYITLHPKIRKAKPSRPPQWDYIGQLQGEVNIPVIANGHIWSWENYLSCWNKQKPGGTMLGRQIARQPWFFALLKREIARESGQILSSDPLKIDLEECWNRFYENLMIHQPLEFYKSRAWRFSKYFSENLAFGYKLHFRHISNCNSAKEMDRLYRTYFAEHKEEKYRVYQ